MPESYVVLRQVGPVPYGLQFEDREAYIDDELRSDLFMSHR